MVESLDALEALATARSMRWFQDKTVDPELVRELVWGATRASSPNNTQPWDFVVVTSPEVRQRLSDALVARLGPALEAARSVPAPEPATSAEASEQRTARGAMNLMGNLHAVPVLVFVCGQNAYPAGAPQLEMAHSAIFAAAQNLLVTARALGLGAAFTTLHQQAEPEIREILGIPADRIIGVTMPVGWPDRPFGPVSRRPVEEVLHEDRW